MTFVEQEQPEEILCSYSFGKWELPLEQEMKYIPKQNWGSVRKQLSVASAIFHSAVFSILLSPEILFITHGHLTAIHAI